MIVGRKGSGKTEFLSQLLEKRLGELTEELTAAKDHLNQEVKIIYEVTDVYELRAKHDDIDRG
jgi:hypothetical protein